MSVPAQVGAGENSGMSLLVQGNDMLAAGIQIDAWKSYSLTANFLTPSDPWHATLGDELLTRDILQVLIPGNRVQWRFGGAPQMAGYITSVDTSMDRSSGTAIVIEGFDSMWPVTDSQIDPNKHYPDKISLEDILVDILPQFGFPPQNIAIDNGDNIDLAANRALHSTKFSAGHRRRRPRRTTTLKRYKLPKKKPQHNDTYWQFLMRLLNRSGLWMWPTVDGLGVVVSSPEYDQDPAFELRRTFDGRDNNIISGGIRRDCQDQPSFIVARGNVPPTVHEHHRTHVVYDNPYIAGLELGLTLEEQDKILGRKTLPDVNSSGPPVATPPGVFNPKTDALLENPSILANVRRWHNEIVDQYTDIIPAKPITEVNVFAPQTARPCFIKDEESHTLDELKAFAKRQMSLHTRKAFIAKYTILGHEIGGVIPQPDMMVSVTDELSGFQGQLWVLARTLNCSRQGGVTTEIELLVPGSIQL